MKGRPEKEETNMSNIKVTHRPDREQLEKMGVFGWPIWEKESSDFPWSYDETETCYFLKGDVVVTPENGEAVTVGEGDLVTFPSGMSCKWHIRQNVKKHYRFG